jgi:hypothetical protein
MAQRSFTALAFVCCILLGCDERLLTDLSDEPEYKAIVGSRYEIIADLAAYGIKRELNRRAEYITLIPPPGIAGPEVEFEIPVKRGSEVTVLKIVKTNRWPDSNLTLIVRMTGTRLPIEQPIRIDLFRGNEGAAGVLINPKIYRKVATSQSGQHTLAFLFF